jgi:hypothetical protein
MTDLNSRLSKAVWDHLDTAKLRGEPFSLSRIEEVIAGVMATERKVQVLKATGYVNGKPVSDDDFRKLWAAQFDSQKARADVERQITEVYGIGRELMAEQERVEHQRLIDARKCQADFMERYKAQQQEPTEPTVKFKMIQGPPQEPAPDVFVFKGDVVLSVYYLKKDPNAFRRAKVGDIVICDTDRNIEFTYGDQMASQHWNAELVHGKKHLTRWTRVA